jgi:hypothetical protein
MMIMGFTPPRAFGVAWHLNARMRQFVQTAPFNYENLGASILNYNGSSSICVIDELGE